MSDQQLAEELHKLIIKNFRKRKVHSFFKDNTWDAGLSDIQLISKVNEGIPVLLCASMTITILQ